MASSSGSKTFRPGDLIWAKMKGFPHWPAQVLPSDADVVVPNRVKVMFFGTRETAFMKRSDLFEYLEHRQQYEVPRKHKGFAEACEEIRVSACAPILSKTVPQLGSEYAQGELPAATIQAAVEQTQMPSTSSAPDLLGPQPSEPSGSGTQAPVEREHNRTRLISTGSRLLSDAFLGNYERKRTMSGRSSNQSRSRASSSASMLKNLHKANKRRRLDSESSNGSRRQKMISGLSVSGLSDKLTQDIFDQFVAPLESVDQLPILEGDQLGLLDGTDGRSTRSRRSHASSRVFEEYFGTRTRHRSGGSFSGGRTRLISGVSDVFEEFINSNAEFSAEALIDAINNLPSEDEERPGTPEEPAPMPMVSRKQCIYCGCECQLYGIKWRCTSKHCLQWNGIHENYANSSNFSLPGPSTLFETTFDDEMMRATAAISRLSSPQPSSRGGDELKPLELALSMAAKKDQDRYNNAEPSTSSAHNNGARIPSPVKPSRRQNESKKEADTEKQRRKLEKERRREETLKKEKESRDKERDRGGREWEKAKEKKSERRVQLISPPSSPPSSSKRGPGRPPIPKNSSPKVGRPLKTTYKVEKTPPMTEHGVRQCTLCAGQVRPQMCGGNRHRWRCVDKKCRKWYGWVKSNDEIPRDLGKKGRWGTNAERRRGEYASDQGSQSDGYSSVDEKEEIRDQPSPPPRKRLGRPPKHLGLKIRLKHSAPLKKEEKKRKFKKENGKKGSEAQERPKTPPSPLTSKQVAYAPSAMERRARWWTSEKRRVDVSPPRDFQTTTADVAASFKVVAHAMRAAAVTRADESGTVPGTLDLLMDTLISTIAPLFSLLNKVPRMKPDEQVLQTVWKASAVHTPMFQ